MHKVYERMLATFEAFRRLDFSSDDIYAGWGDGPIMVLRSQDKEFAVNYVPLGQELSVEEFSRGWTFAALDWNGPMSESEREKIYRENMPPGAFTAMLVKLHEKGFRHSSGRTFMEVIGLVEIEAPGTEKMKS